MNTYSYDSVKELMEKMANDETGTFNLKEELAKITPVGTITIIQE